MGIRHGSVRRLSTDGFDVGSSAPPACRVSLRSKLFSMTRRRQSAACAHWFFPWSSSHAALGDHPRPMGRSAWSVSVPLYLLAKLGFQFVPYPPYRARIFGISPFCTMVRISYSCTLTFLAADVLEAEAHLACQPMVLSLGMAVAVAQ